MIDRRRFKKVRFRVIGNIMITSNLVFSEWEKIFRDPMTTAAAIDRVIHHSVILELNLSSYRMGEAKKAKGGKR